MKDIKEYNLFKENVMDNLLQLRTVASYFGAKEYISSIDNEYNILKEEKFRIIVIGEFSRGKSTFVNALLGNKVLPATVRPTTATINIINYADQPSANIVYKDGDSSKNIPIEQLQRYSVPKENEEYQATEEYKQLINELKNIKWIEILYPTPFCKNGVELIDTPGVNDIDETREEITYSFIPNAHVAILLLDASQCFTKSEKDFVQNRVLNRDISKIFFVINKVDGLDKEELLDLMAYATHEISQVVKAPKIFSVSARDALTSKIKNDIDLRMKSYFDEFENGLTHFLANEHGRVTLEKPVQVALKIIKELQKNAEIRKKLLSNSVKELEEKLEKLKPIVMDIRMQEELIIKDIVDDFSSLNSNIERNLNKQKNTIREKISNYIEKYDLDFDDESLKKFGNSVRKELKSELKSCYEDISTYVNEQERKIVLNFEEKLKNIFVKLDNFETKELNVQQSSILSNAEISTKIESQGLIKQFLTNATIGFTAGWLLGPIGVIGAVVGSFIYSIFNSEKKEAKIKSEVASKAYKALDNAISEFIKQAKSTVEDITSSFVSSTKKEFDAKINSINNSITDALRQKKEQEEKAEKETKIIQEHIVNLDKLNNNFAKIIRDINLDLTHGRQN